MLDYYVVTSLSAKSSEAESFRIFYCKQIAMYKAPDGQNRENRGLRFLRCWTGGCAYFQRLQARERVEG